MGKSGFFGLEIRGLHSPFRSPRLKGPAEPHYGAIFAGRTPGKAERTDGKTSLITEKNGHKKTLDKTVYRTV
jgi:hypothetical protein